LHESIADVVLIDPFEDRPDLGYAGPRDQPGIPQASSQRRQERRTSWYESRDELAGKPEWEGGPAELVVGYGLNLDD
jgi:hypothetical protein